MSKTIVFPLFIAAFVSVAPATPVPDDAKKPVLYFPTKVGTKWVYKDEPQVWTEVVTKVEERGRTKVVSVGREEKGTLKPQFEVEVSVLGVWFRGEKDDPLRPWLCFSPEAEKGWEYDYILSRPAAGKVRLRVFEAEEVKVPAGTFQAIRVEGSRPDGRVEGMRYQFTRWYAPGVGMVKSGNGNWEQVLISFTPGKD